MEEATKSKCVFCEIVAGRAPSLKIYEDDDVLSFLSTARDVDAHILVIPKKHCKGVMDCDEATLGSVMRAVKKISNHLVAHCGYTGVNLLNASDESAGQSVPHFHIHLIPRRADDGLDTWPHLPGAQEEREVVCQRLTML